MCDSVDVMNHWDAGTLVNN